MPLPSLPFTKNPFPLSFPPLPDVHAVPKNYSGNAGNGDSINTKVFEEEREGFGEGEEKLSPESFSSPSPIPYFLSKAPAFSR